MPEGKGPEDLVELDERLMAAPAVAAAQCRRVAVEMASLAAEDLRWGLGLLTEYDPERAELQVDGQRVYCAAFLYLMLHKPAGVLSATEDRRQPTVLDLLPPELGRRGLFPVGRLDKDTTGLLLLTDDGPLSHALLSPRRHVDKVYWARVEGTLDAGDADALREGMTLGDGLRCLPAELEILEDGSQCRVTLREGKYHQVKRMLAARGKPVLALKRLSMGPLALDRALKPGEWRFLRPQEVLALQSLRGVR